MTTTADDKKRVVLKAAKPGDRFDVRVSNDGSIVLRLLQPVRNRPNKARLEKRGKYTVVVTDKVVGLKTDAAEKPEAPPKFKLVKKGGYTVVHTNKQVSMETIKELLAEFP